MSDVSSHAGAWPENHLSPTLRSPWTRLHARQNISGAVYQSPAYFDYLREIDGTGRLDILTLTDKSNDDIIGVVPMRRKTVEMPFTIGERTLLKLGLRGLSLLGSEPMVPEDGATLDLLFEMLMRKYPGEQAIELDAVPLDSPLWKYLTSSRLVADRYLVHVLHGFRDCHFITLPVSVEAYLRKLTRKRRYNYQRQEKLLQEHVGQTLDLALIDRPEQVDDLIAAMIALGALKPAEAEAARRDHDAAARHGFLCCFALTAGSRIIGLVPGTRSNETYRIHRFLYDKALERFSPGAVLWQMVLKRLIRDGQFRDVDMGYGTPAYRYRATNIVKQKGRILLLRKSLSNRARIAAHMMFSAAVNRAKAGGQAGGRAAES